MELKGQYNVSPEFRKEAEDYARKSREYTSDNHDFHDGGLNAKELKMLEGKLGEKVFKTFLNDNNIEYTEDNSSHEVADEYDFLLSNGMTIDVKTRTKDYHTRTLEMVKQYTKNPKDIYVSVKFSSDKTSGQILGWIPGNNLATQNPKENQGCHDNYVAYDNDLSSMDEFLLFLQKNNNSESRD